MKTPHLFLSFVVALAWGCSQSFAAPADGAVPPPDARPLPDAGARPDAAAPPDAGSLPDGAPPDAPVVAESCDRADNDADGRIDEGVGWRPVGPPQVLTAWTDRLGDFRTQFNRPLATLPTTEGGTAVWVEGENFEPASIAWQRYDRSGVALGDPTRVEPEPRPMFYRRRNPPSVARNGDGYVLVYCTTESLVIAEVSRFFTIERTQQRPVSSCPMHAILPGATPRVVTLTEAAGETVVQVVGLDGTERSVATVSGVPVAAAATASAEDGYLVVFPVDPQEGGSVARGQPVTLWLDETGALAEEPRTDRRDFVPDDPDDAGFAGVHLAPLGRGRFALVGPARRTGRRIWARIDRGEGITWPWAEPSGDLGATAITAAPGPSQGAVLAFGPPQLRLVSVDANGARAAAQSLDDAERQIGFGRAAGVSGGDTVSLVYSSILPSEGEPRDVTEGELRHLLLRCVPVPED